jgi:hypothetical protein
VTWYHDGSTYRVTMHPRGGAPQTLRHTRTGHALEFDLDGRAPEDVDHVDVEWPSQALRRLTLIDTPGRRSNTTDTSDRPVVIVDDATGQQPADAVIYLLRHIDRRDKRFLTELHDDEFVRPTPLNTIGVLSRADELSAGDPAAMQLAAKVAERYGQQPLVRSLCSTIVPVAGLLAETAATLTHTEFQHLRTLSHMPVDELADLLVAVDRFVHWPTSVALSTDIRKQLADRLGVFGVRLAASLLRANRGRTADTLAEQLVAASGLAELEAMLHQRFAGRRDLLKASTALNALEHVLTSHASPQTRALERQLEQVRAGAHELTELQLLEALVAGRVPFLSEDREEAERLVGSQGVTVSSRLSLPAGVDPGEARDAAIASLARWQALAESPASARALAEACRVLVRTCEGIIAELSPVAPESSGGSRNS